VEHQLIQELLIGSLSRVVQNLEAGALPSMTHPLTLNLTLRDYLTLNLTLRD